MILLHREGTERTEKKIKLLIVIYGLSLRPLGSKLPSETLARLYGLAIFDQWSRLHADRRP